MGTSLGEDNTCSCLWEEIILVGSWAQQTHSQSAPRAFPEQWDLLAHVWSSCQGLTTAGALCSSVQTATSSMCAASALGGREVKPRGSRDSAHFILLEWDGRGWRHRGLQEGLFWGVTIFYLYKLTKLCGCAWQLAFHNRNWNHYAEK